MPGCSRQTTGIVLGIRSRARGVCVTLRVLGPRARTGTGTCHATRGDHMVSPFATRPGSTKARAHRSPAPSRRVAVQCRKYRWVPPHRHPSPQPSPPAWVAASPGRACMATAQWRLHRHGRTRPGDSLGDSAKRAADSTIPRTHSPHTSLTCPACQPHPEPLPFPSRPRHPPAPAPHQAALHPLAVRYAGVAVAQLYAFLGVGILPMCRRQLLDGCLCDRRSGEKGRTEEQQGGNGPKAAHRSGPASGPAL